MMSATTATRQPNEKLFVVAMLSSPTIHGFGSLRSDALQHPLPVPMVPDVSRPVRLLRADTSDSPPGLLSPPRRPTPHRSANVSIQPSACRVPAFASAWTSLAVVAVDVMSQLSPWQQRASSGRRPAAASTDCGIDLENLVAKARSCPDLSSTSRRRRWTIQVGSSAGRQPTYIFDIYITLF